MVGSVHRGKETERKPIVEIAAEHRIPYAASASVGYTPDLQMKLRKAKAIYGPTFVAVDSPCCLGAGFDGGITMKVAKLAVRRNYIRRVLKETLRGEMEAMRGGQDLVLIVLPGFDPQSFQEVKKLIHQLLRKASLPH